MTSHKRGQLTDDDIFSLLVDQELRVCPITARVFKKNRELKQIHRTHIRGPQKGTYRFVHVCRGNDRKKIAVHRLVWMADTLDTIPEDHDVDHIFGSEYGDEIWNLRLLESAENRRLGAEKTRENTEDGF